MWNAKSMGDVALWTAGNALAEQIDGLTVNFYNGSLPCDRALLERIAEECDVVIACTADCGSCTSWLTFDCVQLEKKGVPAVIIASAGFEDDLEASARAFGVPGIQFVVVPRVYNNITDEQARAQTAPVVGELLKLLTSGTVEAPGHDVADDDDVVFEGPFDLDTFERFNAHFLENDWSDGHPVIPPTHDRVAALVDGIDLDADELVCLVPPGNGYATVRKIAVNAAMAGCLPTDMPVIVAALRALANVPPPLNRAGLMSTSAHAPTFIVNGPLARELGINGGRGCLGPGKQNAVNLRIGRAILLAMKNLGIWNHGVMDLDTMGTTRKHISVFAENEAESPWEPFHVTHGFDPDDSTVSCIFTAGDWDIQFQGHLDPAHLGRAIAANISGLQCLPNLTTFFGDLERPQEGRLLMVPPPHAIPLADGGFSKSAFARLLHQEVREPIYRIVEPLRKLAADGKMRPEWEWIFELSWEEMHRQLMPAIDRPELFHIVVAGSVRGKNLVFPTVTEMVTEKITNVRSAS